MELSESVLSSLVACPIIPVVNFDAEQQVIPYLNTLLESGISTIEIVLRNEQALNCLSIAANHIEKNSLADKLLVGAGTIKNGVQLARVHSLGAQFGLSPGISTDLLERARGLSFPFIPGVATASDIMLGQHFGVTHFKFFPASSIGGVPAIKALSGPFPEVSFCPTGGVSLENMQQYLAQANVFAVGGSWLAQKSLLSAMDFTALQTLMKQSVERLSNA